MLVGKLCSEWVEKLVSLSTGFLQSKWTGGSVQAFPYRSWFIFVSRSLTSLLTLENYLKLKLDISDEEPFKFALNNNVF